MRDYRERVAGRPLRGGVCASRMLGWRDPRGLCAVHGGTGLVRRWLLTIVGGMLAIAGRVIAVARGQVAVACGLFALGGTGPATDKRALAWRARAGRRP